MDCPHCKKKDVKPQHPKLCGKNPDRPHCRKGAMHKQRKYERHNDKTAGNLKAQITTTPKGEGLPLNPSLPVESKLSVLKEINLKGEFETMAEKFNGSKKDEDKESKYKYKCDCGEYFNHPAANNTCPFCGK